MLWPETIEALKGFNFKAGWDRYTVAREFTALCKACKVENHGHYSLRRTFVTLATTADVSQAVISRITGHSQNDMLSIYRQKEFDIQLRKCSEHVRAVYLGRITLE